MEIRNALESDIPAILRLSKSMHGESRYKRFDYDCEKVKELAAYLITDEAGILLIAEKNDKLIGGLMAIVTEHFFGHDKSAMDFGVFVDFNSRNFKTAILLIKEYATQAREKGAVDIGLGTTTGYEPEVVGKLYEGIGFVKVGGNYRLEALI